MSNLQMDNFIAILCTALGNGQPPLNEPDWPRLFTWARNQSLAAVFYVGAAQYPEFAACPPDERQALQRETISTVAQQSRRTQRFLDVYRQLCAGGLRPLVLKGIVCRSLYGELADYRPSCDEDLYIPPGQVDLCCALLKECGFTLASHEASLSQADKMQEISFADSTGVLHLELHPTLFGTDRPDLDRATRWFRDAAIERRAVPVELYGETFYTLHPTDHYLYLYLHLVKHFCNAGVGLRQIIDLARFQLAYQDDIDWPTIQEAVTNLSSPRLYADIMAVARRLGFAVELLTGPEQQHAKHEGPSEQSGRKKQRCIMAVGAAVLQYFPDLYRVDPGCNKAEAQENLRIVNHFLDALFEPENAAILRQLQDKANRAYIRQTVTTNLAGLPDA